MSCHRRRNAGGCNMRLYLRASIGVPVGCFTTPTVNLRFNPWASLSALLGNLRTTLECLQYSTQGKPSGSRGEWFLWSNNQASPASRLLECRSHQRRQRRTSTAQRLTAGLSLTGWPDCVDHGCLPFVPACRACRARPDGARRYSGRGCHRLPSAQPEIIFIAEARFRAAQHLPLARVAPHP